MSSCNYCKHYRPGARFCKEGHEQQSNIFDPGVIHSAPRRGIVFTFSIRGYGYERLRKMRT
jgi:hypothetical protein